MAKPVEPESFEVTEYGDSGRMDAVQGAIMEIVDEHVSKVPNINVRVTFMGKLMKLSYHCYEMHLHQRLRQVESDQETVLREVVKLLKKEFKGKTGEALTLKERKDLANSQIQKVSLNERYMYVGWKFFELE